MSKPRWLRGSRKSWERIGFLKLALEFASSRVQYENFTDALRAYLNSKIKLPYNEELMKWLNANGLGEDIEAKEKRGTQDSIELRRQYWWAYNSSIKSGWLSREAINEYFDIFPKKIGLLDDDHELNEFGRTFILGFLPSDEVEILEGKSVSGPSPLDLTDSQKVFFIYVLLRADGDFLIPLLGELANLYENRIFTYLDAGQLIPTVLDSIANAFRASAYSTDDQYEISEIERLRELIKEQNRIRIEKQGTGSRREQISIPRLEWLVDLGILQKHSSRSYKFTKQGLDFARQLSNYYDILLSQFYAEDCLDKLLNQHLFGPSLKLICGSVKKARQSERLRLLKESYEDLKSAMGYVLIRSLLLVLHNKQIKKSIPLYLEYEDALQSIESEYNRNPLSIYYTVDRLGNEHQVKFSE